MFGDFEGLKQKTFTNESVLECREEQQSYDWCITYKIYTDNVTVQEPMGEVTNHCFEPCKNMEEASAIASNWR